MAGTAMLPYLDAAALRAAMRPSAVVDALASALRGGLDPASSIPRSFVPVKHGELLLMPAQHGAATGVKVASVAPRNPARGLPLIQGVYVLFDAETLRPRALLDGTELTAMRTPAMSLLAVRDRLRSSSLPLHLVVAGTGTQAVRHVETAIDVVRGFRPVASVTYLSRRPKSVHVAKAEAAPTRVVSINSPEADELLGRAGLVVCATSAESPLFNGSLVPDDAAVVAVGSHDPERRELDETLMGRSTVIVEDVATAMREAGDVVQAVRAGRLAVESLIPVALAVTEPERLRLDRPLVFKSTGMGWQDVVVAVAVVDVVQAPVDSPDAQTVRTRPM